MEKIHMSEKTKKIIPDSQNDDGDAVPDHEKEGVRQSV